MPRKLLKRLLPHPDQIKGHEALKRLGDRIHDPNLWHLNRRSVAAAVAIGLFIAFIPTPGQMLLAAALAFWLRANLPIAVVLVWITNPLTMPPIFYAAYILGSWLMLDPEAAAQVPAFTFTVEWFQAEIAYIWKPLLLGCLALGVTSAAVGYFLVRSLWRWHAVSNWQKRLTERRTRRQ